MSLISFVDGNYVVNLHAGQSEAWNSTKRFVVVLAGTQSGKTSFGPLWLHREMQARGPGDYLAVTADFGLFKLKMLPEIRNLFETVLGIGRYWSSSRILEISDPATGEFWADTADDAMYSRIILRSADAPGGLESATAKAAWLDEAGMFPDALPWEATERRLLLNEGRALVTTTLYDLGWLKRVLYDPWHKAKGNHQYIDIINFDSIENPSFPRREWERIRGQMEEWKFNMLYRGRFTRPFGMIYADYDRMRHTMPRAGFSIPEHWPRYLGLDFGGANTAGVFFALDRAPRRVYLYNRYLAGGRSAADHVAALLTGEPGKPISVGGAGSEDQWRMEFAKAGLPVREPPIRDVEVGISRVTSYFKNDSIIIFDDLTPITDQFESYAREVDKKTGETTEKIKNKEAYHYLDAIRYILSYLHVSGILTPGSIGMGGANVSIQDNAGAFQ